MNTLTKMQAKAREMLPDTDPVQLDALIAMAWHSASSVAYADAQRIMGYVK